MQENLNIFYNIKLLVIKALNKHDTHAAAAKALGISERTLYHYKNVFRIYSNSNSGVYESRLFLPDTLKCEIVKMLHSVERKNGFGDAINAFLNKKVKTDDDFTEVLTMLKDQMLDVPVMMEKLLGDTYQFFQLINA